MAAIGNRDWTLHAVAPIVVAGGKSEQRPLLLKGRAVNNIEDIPDRSYWTAYDHFKIEQEARALRRAAIYATASNIWQRMRVAFAHAGAQPVKPSRTAGA